jgi:hypothetical protein
MHFDPRTLQVHDGDDGKVKIHTDWRIRPTDSGSHLSHTAELEPVWYLAPPHGGDVAVDDAQAHRGGD